MVDIDTSSFHEYDIRGTYPDKINEDFYYRLGRSVALYVGKGPIAIGHDARLSSPSLYKAMIDGITDYSIDVVGLGLISTEMHYFASGKYGYEANVMITASHNPAEYNGAKIVTKGVVPLSGSFGLPEIKKYMNEEIKKPSKKGSFVEKDVFEEWIEHVLSFVDRSSLKPLKVVVDAGNGMAGPTWQALAKRLPVTIVPMFLEPDGNFPNHLPDPLKDENIQELLYRVKYEKADMGIAFDGDADRVFFVDNNGEKLSGTVTTAILAEYFLKKEKGVIMYNALCGRVVRETIERYGGIPVRTRVGHSIIKKNMREQGAIFAGEHSGHLYFRDNFCAEASAVAALIMMQILSESKKTLAQIADHYRVYPPSGEINFRVSNQDEVIAKIIEKYKSAASSFDELDGASFWFRDWWFNVRKSNTEPLLRLTIEADTEKILASREESIIKTIIDAGGVRE